MTRDDVFKRLQSIFEDVFVESTTVSDELTLIEIPGYDSLSHISLMMSIEKHFGVHFEVGEVETIQNIGELVDLIQKKTQESSARA